MYSTLSLIHLRVNNVSKEFSSAIIYKVRYMLIVSSSKVSHSHVFTCEVGHLGASITSRIIHLPKTPSHLQ